jgi:pSer/pThr/pTyr-binding forkhead associated (FHA) protein
MSSVPPADAPLKAQVLCRVRPGITERFRLRGTEAVVGREPGLAVSVAVASVSRRHARLSFDGKGWWVEGLSPAGTFLNGTLVARDRLHHLDVITLGRNVDLLFLLKAAGPVSTPGLGIVRAGLRAGGADELREIAMGEITLGRASANNVVVDQAAVSKMHARITRTATQLVLQDLGSSNGTFVNGQRVTTALLRDGDVVALGNVADFRVTLELGELGPESVHLEPPGSPPTPIAARSSPRFTIDWKTRYDWDAAEMQDIAALQRRIAEERATVKQPVVTVPKPAAPAKPAAPVKPAAPTPRPAPAAKPAATPTGALIEEIEITGPDGTLTVSRPGTFLLGRANEAELRLGHATVSRRHACITFSDDRRTAQLQDVGGAGGTRLNGVSLERPVRLSDGDAIGVGQIELRVRIRLR